MSRRIHDSSPSKKHRSGTTGPRTVAGRARSSQNAAKHQIFSRGILENEKREASRLYAQIQLDMRPRSALALELIGDLVLNRLQKYRIDTYAAHEFKKANLVAILDESDPSDKRLRRGWLGPTPSPDNASSTNCDRLDPRMRIPCLQTLKANVEKRGPEPDKDLKYLDWIYSGRIPTTALPIVLQYKMLQLSENPGEADVSIIPSDKSAYKASVVAAINSEIQLTEMLAEFEGELGELNNPAKGPILLDDSVADRIERYGAANARNLTHILDALQRTRRLGK